MHEKYSPILKQLIKDINYKCKTNNIMVLQTLVHCVSEAFARIGLGWFWGSFQEKPNPTPSVWDIIKTKPTQTYFDNQNRPKPSNWLVCMGVDSK